MSDNTQHEVTIAYMDALGMQTLQATHRTTGHYDITQYENELLWVNEELPGDDTPEWRFGIRAELVVSITIEPLGNGDTNAREGADT